MDTPREASPPSPPLFGFGKLSDRLGWWNFYFIAKLILVAMRLIGLHLVENLLLLALLGGPLASPRAKRFRPWIGAPLAIASLYHDSWLPSFSRVVSQASLVSSFSGAYLAELAGRFVSWPVIAALAVALAVYLVVSRFVRLDVVVAIAVVALALAIQPPAPAAPSPVAEAGKAAPKTPDVLLKEFFQAEATRSVSFAKPPESAPPFDVIFVHVCSLSWDDLQATGLDKHPLLSAFDIVLTRFNAVSTYSGPAAIRILRGACGQQPHVALYNPAPENCLLMPQLRSAGFDEELAMNHDGHFDDFLGYVRKQGVQAAPLPIEGVAAPMRAFDESKIHDDAAVLSRWLDRRSKETAPRAALYYNTVSLHDGNKLQSDPKKSSIDTYKVRAVKLLDDVNAFLGQLAARGRRAIVVFIPEHGVAFRGDATQIAGLRELPTPDITLVPVGIKVIGPDARRAGDPLRVDEPTSFLAISHIVSRMLAKPPYGADGFKPADYTAGMPVTEFVSEGENAVILRRGNEYLMRQEQEGWKPFSTAAAK